MNWDNGSRGLELSVRPDLSFGILLCRNGLSWRLGGDRIVEGELMVGDDAAVDVLLGWLKCEDMTLDLFGERKGETK